MLNKQKLNGYVMLMRLHRPIPILLILWPTLTALVIASDGIPTLKNIIIFSLGVLIMRTLGCVINDMADKDFDKDVKRTKTRPLASGVLTSKEALVLSIALGVIAFICVLFLNTFTILLSFVSLFLATLYPFCKRFFVMPQFVLGLAFNFGILMAFSAVQNTVPLQAWIFYLATICWTIAYDTIYALADRDFDLDIGINSSAILFGKKVFSYIFLFNLIAIVLLIVLGIYSQYNLIYYFGLLISTFIFIRNYFIYKKLGITNCIKAFSDNHWVGFIIFIAIAINYTF